jgi:hypothetical protein
MSLLMEVLKMLHEVKSKRDIIQNGIIYHPSDGLVDLPEKMVTADCKPYQAEIKIDPVEDIPDPEIPEDYEKEKARNEWIEKNGTARGFEANWKKEHKE